MSENNANENIESKAQLENSEINKPKLNTEYLTNLENVTQQSPEDLLKKLFVGVNDLRKNRNSNSETAQETELKVANNNTTKQNGILTLESVDITRNASNTESVSDLITFESKPESTRETQKVTNDLLTVKQESMNQNDAVKEQFENSKTVSVSDGRTLIDKTLTSTIKKPQEDIHILNVTKGMEIVDALVPNPKDTSTIIKLNETNEPSKTLLDIIKHSDEHLPQAKTEDSNLQLNSNMIHQNSTERKNNSESMLLNEIKNESGIFQSDTIKQNETENKIPIDSNPSKATIEIPKIEETNKTQVDIFATNDIDQSNEQINKCQDQNECSKIKLNLIKKRFKPNMAQIIILSALKASQMVLIFLWTFLKDILSLVFSRQKVIRNRIVLITGSGGYLGRYLACELSKRGVTLILWDINEEENQKTYDALRALGHRRMYLYKVNLLNENDVRECAQRVKSKHGFISIMVLCAATVCDIKSIFEKDTQELAQSFTLFYQSHIWLYQEFLPQMIEKNEGHLALISSQLAFGTFPKSSTYASLKVAQTKLLECVDSDLNMNKSNEIKTSIVYLGALKNSAALLKNTSLKINEELVNDYAMHGEEAAKRIVKGILKNRKYIYVPGYVYLLNIFYSVFPKRSYEKLLNSDELLIRENEVNDSKKNE